MLLRCLLQYHCGRESVPKQRVGPIPLYDGPLPPITVGAQWGPESFILC